MTTKTLPLSSWQPTTLKEMQSLGWEQADVILFSGDAYVDHPSFGTAIIARVLEAHSFKVAIVAQPNWKDDLRDFKKMGKPRLCFAATAGAMDSMINHYTANKRLRSDDAYTPGGKSGFRPDRALTVYSQILKNIFPEVPLVIGGIEASMRRLTHYDYWNDKLHPSILFDTAADFLVYGMGEKAIVEICQQLQAGKKPKELKSIPQTAVLFDSFDEVKSTYNNDFVKLYSHQECEKDKRLFAKNYVRIEKESVKRYSSRIVQQHNDKVVVVNPPNPFLKEDEMDSIYDLPFTRLPHPKYKKRGEIPAYQMIRHSVTSHRGCFGSCAFCAISAHQGKEISSRSQDSIMKEVEKITEMPDFTGHITDVGGPTANMYGMKGFDDKKCEECKRISCLWPKRCSNLNHNHSAILSIYQKIRQEKNVKKLSIGSGIRYDLFMEEGSLISNKNEHKSYFETLIKYHVSGRLKVAPEHTEEKVLKSMRKPDFHLFISLQKAFESLNQREKTNYQLIPYLISAHPNCSKEDMLALQKKMKKIGIKPAQVQAFTPSPMTASTVMYYTGLDLQTLKPLYVAKSQEARKKQHELFFWYKNEKDSEIKNKKRSN
jgi:uncharacterized radical SAM protein YgiQ